MARDWLNYSPPRLPPAPATKPRRTRTHDGFIRHDNPPAGCVRPRDLSVRWNLPPDVISAAIDAREIDTEPDDAAGLFVRVNRRFYRWKIAYYNRTAAEIVDLRKRNRELVRENSRLRRDAGRLRRRVEEYQAQLVALAGRLYAFTRHKGRTAAIIGVSNVTAAAWIDGRQTPRGKKYRKNLLPNEELT